MRIENKWRDLNSSAKWIYQKFSRSLNATNDEENETLCIADEEILVFAAWSWVYHTRSLRSFSEIVLTDHISGSLLKIISRLWGVFFKWIANATFYQMIFLSFKSTLENNFKYVLRVEEGGDFETRVVWKNHFSLLLVISQDFISHFSCLKFYRNAEFLNFCLTYLTRVLLQYSKTKKLTTPSPIKFVS